MKSLFKSNISWFMILSLFQFLKPAYAMDENKTKINSYSVNQLQNDFIGLKKNPQKYVKFQLNTEKTIYPDAGGLYELLPYYQKINPLGETSNYAIQFCDFEKQWQLIKVNPLGDLPRLNVEQTTIATLLEGDQFSRPTTADIKAYTTFEQMQLAIKTVGEKNKELKLKIMEMEIVNDEVFSLRETNKKLEKILIRMKEHNIRLKAYALEQNDLTKRANEQNKIHSEENQKMLKEIQDLTSNLKEKEIQIKKKNEEKRALEYEKGDLSYKLDHTKEYEQKFLSLEKEVKPLKNEIKNLTADIKESMKQWDIKTYEVQTIFHKHNADMQKQNEELKNFKNEKQVLKEEYKKFKLEKNKELDRVVKKMNINFKEELEKVENRIKEHCETTDSTARELKKTYDVEYKKLKDEIQRQKELLDQQNEKCNQ